MNRKFTPDELETLIAKRKAAEEPLSYDEIGELVRINYGYNLASYLRSPVTDDDFLKFLENRLNGFHVSEIPASAALARDFVFDLGGETLNDSSIVAAIDVGKSKGLIQYLSRRLSYKASRENTFAAFVTRRVFDPKMSRRVGSPTFGYREFILITTHDDKKKDYGLHLLDQSGLRTLFYKLLSREDLAIDSAIKLDGLIPHQRSRFTGLFNRLLVLERDEWSLRRFQQIGWIIKGEEKWRQYLHPQVRRIYDPTAYQVVKPTVKEAAPDYEHLPTSNLLISEITASEYKIVGTTTVIPSSWVASIVIIDGPADDPSGEIRYGTPNGAGSAGCKAYPSISDCKACCMAYQSAGIAGVIAGAVACHGSTCWWCPACHIVCGAVELIAAGLIIWYFEKCKDNCEVEYWHEY